MPDARWRRHGLHKVDRINQKVVVTENYPGEIDSRETPLRGLER